MGSEFERRDFFSLRFLTLTVAVCHGQLWRKLETQITMEFELLVFLAYADLCHDQGCIFVCVVGRRHDPVQHDGVQEGCGRCVAVCAISNR